MITVVMLLGTTALTYLLGGTKHATPHLYYVPIIFASFTLRASGGFATAVVAALLAGIVPLDTATGATQSWFGVSLRAALFLAIAGTAIGALSATRRIDGETEYDDMRRMLTETSGESTGEPIDAELLANVVRDRQLATVFQPIYELRTGKLLAVEALTRFDIEPIQPPDVWFAAAYRHGRGPDLEIAAIRSALNQAVGLPDGVRVSINVGPDVLTDARLHGLLASVQHTIPVMLEITEHTAIVSYTAVQESLIRLRNLGVTIAVDDAGSGFSSLRHVLQLQPEVIKIDRTLAAQITASPARQALGRTLIEFGHEAGAHVVIEGIESPADLQAWRELGAEAVQGFLTGRPRPLPADPVSDVIVDSLGART